MWELSGGGTIDANLAAVFVSPGDSGIGNLTIDGDLDATGSLLNWEIGDASATAGQGVGWDGLTVNGAVVAIGFQLLLAPRNADGVAGRILGFNPRQSYQWPVLHASDLSNFDVGSASVFSDEFRRYNPTASAASFRLAVRGNELLLIYNVPEPTSMLLLAEACCFMLSSPRRRSRIVP